MIAFASCLRGRLARERQRRRRPGARASSLRAHARSRSGARTGTPSAGRRRSRDRKRRRRRRRRRCCVQGMRSTRRSDPGSPSRRRVPRCRAARSEARLSPAAHRRARSRSRARLSLHLREPGTDERQLDGATDRLRAGARDPREAVGARPADLRRQPQLDHVRARLDRQAPCVEALASWRCTAWR